jgi:hypothetical protein
VVEIGVVTGKTNVLTPPIVLNACSVAPCAAAEKFFASKGADFHCMCLRWKKALLATFLLYDSRFLCLRYFFQLATNLDLLYQRRYLFPCRILLNKLYFYSAYDPQSHIYNDPSKKSFSWKNSDQ